MNMITTNPPEVVECGKVRRRVLTAARKEQNRLAQRAYRQRQRELKSQSKTCHVLQHNQPRQLKPWLTKRTHPDNSTGSGDILLEDLSNGREEVDRLTEDSDQVIIVPGEVERITLEGDDCLHLEPCSTDRCTTNQQESGILEVAPDINPTLYPEWLQSTDYDLAGFHTNLQSTEPVTSESSPPRLEFVSQVHDLNAEPEPGEPILNLSTWSLDRESQQISAVSPRRISRISEADPLLDGNYDIPSQMHPESLLIMRHPYLPDPFMNTLQLARQSLFIAAMYNARALGIDLAQVMTPNYLSPFYRPTTPADDPKALVAAASNPSFPAYLQPTLPQILFPHHAYLDLLPFPVLRARAIAFAVTRPLMFDPKELKLDIYVNAGLLCWNTGKRNTSGHSWDMRTYEVAPWFMSKWKMLLVKEENDVWM